jgi:hypothetical protein
MARAMKLFFWSAILSLLAGCSAQRWKLPDFRHPGHIDSQRANAELFDPYPQPNNGYPVRGLRPPGYRNPASDHTQAQRFTKSLSQPTPPSPPPYAVPYKP